MWTCKRRIGLSIRVLLMTYLLTGGIFIGIGFAFHNPPTSLANFTVIAIGSLTFLIGFFGFCGSFGVFRCQKLFLVFALLPLTVQAGGLISLFISSNTLIDWMTTEKDEEIVQWIQNSKWPFAVILFLESMAYLLLFLSFCCFEEEFTFDAFQESPTAKERLDLTKIKTSMAGRSSFDLDSSAAAKKLHQKMARKYGHLSHTTDWGSGKKCWPFV